MNKMLKKGFFKRDGKVLKCNQNYSTYREKVSSLFDDPQIKSSSRIGKLNAAFKILPNTNSKIVFSAISMALVIILISPLVFSILKQRPAAEGNKYSIYSSKPLTLDKSTQDVDYRDSRAQKINEIFKFYSCPLEGMGDVFVNEADKNDIPWYLAAAVAFQESGCGKNTPKVDGDESYNAWGWGIYGSTVHTFENWVRGIETVSGYFNQKFFSRGITDTCDIMKIYTPSSNGSWCAGVNEFADKIKNYQTP